MFKIRIIVFSLLLLAFTAKGQEFVNDNNGSNIKVSFITCYAGSDIYELCGHSAIRIIGPDYDVAVNYGMFDFNAPNFIYRFVKGETDYSVAAMPTDYFLNQYRLDQRRVVEQQLNLTQEQAEKLVELITENLRPENRTYRYNYVLDNCATRPVAIIEKAIGDTISFQKSANAPTTFRNEMRHFHKNYPWYQLGIDLALGNGIDRQISERERGFAPETLEALLAKATVSDSIGNNIPLVTATTILNEGHPDGVQLPPTPFYATPLFIFTLLLIVTIGISWRDIRHKKTSRWFDSLLFGCLGLLGLIMTFLIFVSVHEATSPNYLYLWINPFCLIAAIVTWLKKYKCLLFYYHFANFVALILLCIIWNRTSQSGNVAFIPLLLCDMIRSATYIYIIKCAEKKTD